MRTLLKFYNILHKVPFRHNCDFGQKFRFLTVFFQNFNIKNISVKRPFFDKNFSPKSKFWREIARSVVPFRFLRNLGFLKKLFYQILLQFIILVKIRH